MNSVNRVVVEINLAEIKNNFRKILAAASPANVTAVVKANAYGLGAVTVAETCRDAGADSLAVADLNEALELKEIGLPVMVLGSMLPAEIPFAVENDIIIPVNSLACARKISTEAVRQNKQAQFQILLDTGMGRLGIPVKNAHQEIKQIFELPSIKCIGIYSHFPVADSPGNDYTLKQIADFKILLSGLQGENISFPNIHTANSDAVNNYPQAFTSPFNRVRTGLSMYGYTDPSILGLKPVLAVKSKLTLVRTLPAGSSIGYGRTHSLKYETRLGTIAAGYADGIPLALSNRGAVLIKGKKCPIIGRVSMDYSTVDLSAVPDAECNDEAVLIGIQDSENISLQSWAEIKNTHVHDILCGLASRAKCVYV
jgi:alanine racemase